MEIPDREGEGPEVQWLLLAHQIPAKPAYLRVKVWRRLLSLGSVALKNSVYALPMTDGALEDFQWLLKEIVDGGGEAIIFQSRLIAGLSDAEAETLFREARAADYEELAKALRSLASAFAVGSPPTGLDPNIQLTRIKARRDQIVAIDFFGANGRDVVDGLLASFDLRLRAGPTVAPKPTTGEPPAVTALTGGTWVTREGVFVDRIASAWLIRRFIDTGAKFKFVPAKGYVPSLGELRFDMFEAEYTHEGDRCTFEVLLVGVEQPDDALTAIAEIVHDIDLKDGKFSRVEAPGIELVLSGICSPDMPDEDRILRGGTVFEDLYRSFSKARR